MPRYIVSVVFLALCLAVFQPAAVAGDAPAAPPEPAAISPGEDAPGSSDAAVEDEGKAHCTLSVPGMHCGGCAKQVAKRAGSVEGVGKVDVRLDDHEVDVSYDPAKTSPEKLKEAVSQLYEATIKPPAAEGDAKEGAAPASPEAKTEDMAPPPYPIRGQAPRSGTSGRARPRDGGSSCGRSSRRRAPS